MTTRETKVDRILSALQVAIADRDEENRKMKEGLIPKTRNEAKDGLLEAMMIVENVRDSKP